MQTPLDEQRRPYAPPANVLAILQRARSRNLPDHINDDFLSLAGVSEGARGRVMDALRFLGLVSEDDRPSEALRALSSATDDEYPALLAGVVRDAYRQDFDRVNPSEDSQAKIVGAFRPYRPRSQTARMVMLFLGLCREAGIPVSDAPRERQMKSSPSPPRRETKTTDRRGSDFAPPAAGVLGSRPSPTLFGVTEEDIAVLNEQEFNEVWGALGKVARARARAKKQLDTESSPPTSPQSLNGQEGGEVKDESGIGHRHPGQRMS